MNLYSKLKSIIVPLILNFINLLKTKYSQFKNQPKQMQSRSRNINNSRKPVNNSRQTINRNNNIKSSSPILSKKRIISIGVGVVVLFILFTIISASSAKLKVYAEIQDYPVSKQQDITANFGSTDGIQAFTKTQTEDGSDSTATTGTGKVGTPAAGSVRATYLQAAGTITIKAGTLMTCADNADCGGKQLFFKTMEDHTFSLATSPVTINLQANDIGEDYNLRTGIKFTVQGVSASDISITNVSPFIGGTSRDTRTVAQKDIDDLQSRLTDSLKSSAYSKITTAAGPNSTILQDKVKVDVKSVTTDKKVGEEAENVSMNMEVNITASGYDKSTVQPFVENLLKQEERDNLKLDLNTVDIKQSVKSSNDKSIVITINASGLLRPNIDKDNIIKDLQGKSLDNIEKTINNIPNVSNVSYNFSPNWIPGFMKHVPDSKSNIDVELKEKQ